MTVDLILKALSNVQEPDLGKDLVTLNMITDLVVEGDHVSFTIVLTTPACPMKDLMKNACENAIKLLVNKQAIITVNFTSNTTSRRQDEKTVLAQVKNIIAVVSGKGGVGKSTVSANLALALAEGGAKVGLMDADIYGPSLPQMLGTRERPRSEGQRIMPLSRWGLKAMSIGFLVEEETPMIWRGPMVMGALEQMMGQVAWGPLDVMIVDMPPGTGDAQLTMSQRVPLAGAVIVSTPQDVALLDARRGVRMFEKVNVPVLGLIENMSFFCCPNCNHRSDIFSHGGAKREAERLGVEFLGELPLKLEIRELADAGTPIVMARPDSEEAQSYRRIARRVWEKAAAKADAAPKIVME